MQAHQPPTRPAPAAAAFYMPVDAVLSTRIALVQALTTVIERIEVSHNYFAAQRIGGQVSDLELRHVRTLALALMCRYCDDARTGLGARLEKLVFPDDVAAIAPHVPRHEAALLPTITDELVTEPAPFDDTMQIDTLHLATTRTGG